ncbi:hypothetical protein QBC35DRAFT_504654 [Podospora australis]|uniref:DUF1754-domain-containing protein n=1 Tax=Podospora australis TaxID=1536484 RepID=A0AAN7AGG1_9PEZI|nr:hypothetical protein QBC35DRAFT_504654 [Podospora australis]
MGSDDYTSIARGPLKLKGVPPSSSAVTKKKKKKSKKTDLEKNLSTGDNTDANTPAPLSREKSEESGQIPQETPRPEGQEAEDDDIDAGKTEAEKRFAEIKRKRLKELAEGGRGRPELLKTHKQRVEELNTALSRLSEHHDMPKIGPG